MIITNRCGYAHPKNAVCRECEYLARKDADEFNAGRGDVDAREPISDGFPSPVEDGSDASVPDVGSEVSDVPPLSKSDRLAVAQEALSDKARASRYRENKKKSDPDWLKREAERQKARRAKIRGSPSD